MTTVREFRMQKFNEQFTALSDVLMNSGGSKSDPAVILHDESRRFVGSCVRFSAPKTKQQGETAVERDLKKVFTPVNEELLNMVGSQFGTTGIDAWFTTSEGEKKHLKWDRIDPTGSGMKAFHNQNRDSRGRARSTKRQQRSAFSDEWRAAYVVAFRDFASYLAQMKSHVGRKKAAWAVSFIQLGGKVPQWISRHLSGARGTVQDDLHNFSNPSVTVSSFAPGVMDDERLINDSLRARTEAMGKRMRLIIRGYKQDIDAGRKPNKRAQEFPAEVIAG